MTSLCLDWGYLRIFNLEFNIKDMSFPKLHNPNNSIWSCLLLCIGYRLFFDYAYSCVYLSNLYGPVKNETTFLFWFSWAIANAAKTLPLVCLPAGNNIVAIFPITKLPYDSISIYSFVSLAF